MPAPIMAPTPIMVMSRTLRSRLRVTSTLVFLVLIVISWIALHKTKTATPSADPLRWGEGGGRWRRYSTTPTIRLADPVAECIL